MYNLTKIYKDHTDNAWKAGARTYQLAYKNAATLAKADSKIVSILIFSEVGTAIVIKRENLLKYGQDTISTRTL